MNKMPESLRVATTTYVDELLNHDLGTRLRVLVSLITSEISRKDPKTRDYLAAYVVYGIFEVLDHMSLLHVKAKQEVERVLAKLSKQTTARKFN